MDIGDKLMCKKNIFHLGTDKKIFNFFKKPIFKKGKRYEILNINIYTTHGCTVSVFDDPNYTNVKKIQYKEYYFNGIKINEKELCDIFYSLKEERRNKIKNINIYE